MKRSFIAAVILAMTAACIAQDVNAIVNVEGSALIKGQSGANAGDYEGAITAKMSEINSKQAELLAAQRQLAILSEFLDNFDTKTSDITAARQQLRSADVTLADINNKNLIKTTIQLGIVTCNEVADKINIGKTAANALITHGLRNAVGKVALETLQSGADNARKKAMGLDDETLCSPRNVKIKAVSDAARATFPNLGLVQETLALDGYAVASACLKQTGKVILPTGPGVIYYKNGMVRTAIATALGTLDALSTEAATAKTDADLDLPLAQAEVSHLEEELATLIAALDDLKAQQLLEEGAARLAANQSAVSPPVHQPIPPQEENEPIPDYQTRVRNAAIARWNAEAPITAITNCQAQIEARQTSIDTGVSVYLTTPRIAGFISTFYGDTLDANTTASYNDSISSCAAIQQWVTDVTPTGPALPGLIVHVEALTDLYNTLFNLQNQTRSLKTLLEESGYSDTPENYYSSGWSNIPGMGQAPAEDLAVSLGQYLTQLPVSLVNAQTLADKLADAVVTWSGGIASVSADLDGNLSAAEGALAVLIAQGLAWENALASSSGLVLGPLEPILNIPQNPPIGRLGYFSQTPEDFTLVVGHAFSMATYKTSLLAALATPGSAGLTAARALQSKYEALVTANPAFKDAYDSAWHGYQAAFARVQAYEGGGSLHRLLVYDDWTNAATYSSEAHPIDASAVSNQLARYHALLNTSEAVRLTGLTGEPTVGGETQDQILHWNGLPNMRDLPDPGLDAPTNYLPHRITAMKAVIIEEVPSWFSMAEADFIARFNAVMDQLWDLSDEAFLADDGSYSVVTGLRNDELAPLQSAYYAAHPAPTITVQPASSIAPITAGSTAQLSVTATSDLLTYQWSMASDFGGLYTDIEGATSNTVTTPALSATCWFRVVIRNPGGTVSSDPARIEVSGGGATNLVFTTASSASARVGVSFLWMFATSLSSQISINPMATLPPGVSALNGKLEGIPTTAGTWDILVMASLPGPPGPENQPIQQTFHLTIIPWDADGDGIPDTWEQEHCGNITNGNPHAVCSNGINTVLEAYLAGFDPNDEEAGFGITGYRPGTNNILDWNAVSGRVYSVYWTTNLLSGFQCLESNIPWTKSGFTNATLSPCGYYKINVGIMP